MNADNITEAQLMKEYQKLIDEERLTRRASATARKAWEQVYEAIEHAEEAGLAKDHHKLLTSLQATLSSLLDLESHADDKHTKATLKLKDEWDRSFKRGAYSDD